MTTDRVLDLARLQRQVESDQPAALVTRYAQLQRLQKRVEVEIAAVRRGLQVSGILDVRGRPMKPPTHTHDEAKEAHQLHQKGDTSDWVKDGERQYQRQRARVQRSMRKKAAA